MSKQSDPAREALRAVWDAQGDASEAIDEECSPTKSCKNMKGITFDGFAEPGSDLRAAWRDKLAREGKLGTAAGSVHDLVFRQMEPH